MHKLFFRLALFIALFGLQNATVQAQNGDQILDGIGETGLAARYMFNADLRDWSRNNLHGKAQGTEISFVADHRFGKVLSLSGKSNSFVNLPANTLTDVESLSLSVWLYLSTDQTGHSLFTIGKNAGEQFSLDIPPSLAKNKWVHLSYVVDVAAKTTTTYIDGKSIAEAKEIPKYLGLALGQQSADNIFIGKSLTSASGNLSTLLHDFRIYRVALSKNQVSGIHRNAVGSSNQVAVTATKPEDDLPQFSASQPQLYNIYLSQVADIQVDTELGSLPRLPSYVPGTYINGIKDLPVRVLWPATVDNVQVLKEGQYTLVGRVPGTDFQPKAVVNVKATKSITPQLKLASFALKDVELNTDHHGHLTKFMENRDKFIDALAKTDPNSFLYMFRHAFGQQQPAGAKPLGVWDSQDTKLRGHATGHYLSAIAQAYAGTGYDKKTQAGFARKMDYMVNTLYELAQLSGKQKTGSPAYISDPRNVPFGPSKAGYDSDLSDEGIRNDYWNWGKGFISAYPPDQFIMLEQGAKYGGQKNQIWAPYYTLHKILAGLIDVYEVSGNKKALEVAKGMADWVYARLSLLPTETRIKMWDTYIAGEFGGMNETLAHLYRITGKADYLKAAQLFDNIRVFYGDPEHTAGLARNLDSFHGLHANQHIPQIVGSIEMYHASSNPEYFKIADNFWYKAVNDYIYSIGGVAGARNPANAECFISQPATLYQHGFSEGGQNETCATYNMLKLTSQLFLFDQRAELMDYYERGLYNHILASVAEHSPANTYHVPLRPGSIKQFGNADMKGFTCCNGTAMESSTKLQNSIYFKSKDNSAVYVNLYVPSTLSWRARKVVIEQSTNFPKEDLTRLKIKGSGKFDLMVRVPSWATKGFFVKINGENQKLEAKPGSYLSIHRNWKSGDIVELKMPFVFHLDPVMDQQNIASLFYGPILLAAQEPEARKEWRKVSLDAEDISRSIKGDPEKLQFSIDGVVFKPFYESYGRHSVYLDVLLR